MIFSELLYAAKNGDALALGAKGQFYKNTVYFVRDMPYSCFCLLF